jgi:hypothetical protein
MIELILKHISLLADDIAPCFSASNYQALVVYIQGISYNVIEVLV